MTRSSVLILGVYYQTLAVMRSLHDAGFEVILGRGPGRCVEESSASCDGVWIHPPFESPEFGVALESYLDSRPGIRFLFPVGEEVSLAVAGLERIHNRDIALIMVEPSLLRSCLNKPCANEIAARAGLIVPASKVVRSLADLTRAAQGIGFPVIVKPLTSKRPIFKRKAYLVRNREEFESVFVEWPDAHAELLVQAYIEGPLKACDFVAQSGRVVGYFEAASVRTDMPDGTGFAVDFLSRPVSPDVLEHCRRFCAATGYDGPGLLQFIRSDRDGALYFVENNPRLSAGIAQPVMCGQDMPLLSLRVAAARRAGERIESFDEKAPYIAGVRTHWLYRDLQGILYRRTERTVPEIVGRIRALLSSLLRADNHMVWRWRDPKPSIVLYARLVRSVLRALRSRRD